MFPSSTVNVTIPTEASSHFAYRVVSSVGVRELHFIIEITVRKPAFENISAITRRGKGLYCFDSHIRHVAPAVRFKGHGEFHLLPARIQCRVLFHFIRERHLVQQSAVAVLIRKLEFISLSMRNSGAVL